MKEWCVSSKERKDLAPLFSEPTPFKKNIEISRINTSVFLVFLIKVDKLNILDAKYYFYQLKDMDNCYLRLAIPAPWLDKEY